MQKSLFTKYFTACAAMIIVSITILGALFLAFAAQYFKMDRENTLERNVQHAVVLTQQSVVQDNGQDKLDSSIMAPGFNILSKATDADIFFVNTQGKTLYCTQQNDCPHSTFLIPESIMNQVKVVRNSLNLGIWVGFIRASIIQSDYRLSLMELMLERCSPLLPQIVWLCFYLRCSKCL